MYKYYIQFNSEEHMLFAKEIAEIFGIYTIKNNPHSLLIKAMIVDFLSEHNIKYNAMFFETKNGLREVFPQNYYLNAIKLATLDARNGIYVAKNNKKYNFKLKGEMILCHT